MYKKNALQGLAGLALATLLSLTGTRAQAQTFCVFDPLGTGGDYYSMFQDYQLAAKRWGVNIDLKVYPDDLQLDEAFKSGQCDMASMIGHHARLYNAFTGTLDAPSVIENYSEEREAMNLIASPKATKYMVSGGYEVVGVIPAGAAYPFVNDRRINSFLHATGKKVGVMEWDKTQTVMAEHFNVTPVPLPLIGLGPAFNTGKVDVIVVPVALYKALELNKGIGTTGGVIRRPLFCLTMQLVAHTGKFPPDFGQKSREYMNGQTDHALGIIHNLESGLDSHMWIYATRNNIEEWNTSMRSLLGKLMAQNFYDPRMVSILRRIRCKTDSNEPECAPTAEQRAEGYK